MRRFLLPLFVALLIAVGAFILATSAELPERVASHFARDGAANRWMPRDAYLAFILTLALGVPLLIVALMAWLPRVFPRLVNLPNRAYWLDPERRDATLRSVVGFAWALGCFLTLFVGGLHAALLWANARTPPTLDESALKALLAAFLVAVGCWALAWTLRFRRPR